MSPDRRQTIVIYLIQTVHADGVFIWSQGRTGSSNRPELSRQTGLISSAVTRNSDESPYTNIQTKPSIPQLRVLGPFPVPLHPSLSSSL